MIDWLFFNSAIWLFNVLGVEHLYIGLKSHPNSLQFCPHSAKATSATFQHLWYSAIRRELLRSSHQGEVNSQTSSH